jgi:hypothetical protein
MAAARAGVLALLVAAAAPPTPAQAKTDRPLIRRLSPTSDTALGGQRVTVFGRHFTRVQFVDFGTRRGKKLRVPSAYKLTVLAPAQAAGRVEVSVWTRHGRSSTTRAANFRFTAVPPTIDSTAPATATSPLPTPIVPDGWSGPNPTSNCTGGTDYCGAAMEGLAPLPPPTNWSQLSNTDQAFVVLSLERIERGEPPLVGESATLDGYAAQGSATGDDPDGPGQEAGNWDSDSNSVAAIPDYLYDDGPGSFNEACMGTQMWGCWGHRDNILDDSNDPALAVGLADGANGSAESFSDEFSDLTFTWAQELSEGYPQGLPSSFALTPVTLTTVRPAKGSGRSVTLSGAGLDTASAVYFANVKASAQPDCDNAAPSCTVTVPRGLDANTTYYVYVQNPAGLSAASAAATYTTAP